jgi:L-amino acid N-acyltransferase YncA
MNFTWLTPENVVEESLFCNKNPKTAGFKQKTEWFTQRQKEGLQLIIAKDEGGKAIGFIEFVPGKYAWRPVEAENYMFIHCIMVYPNKARNNGVASALINICRKEAEKQELKGLAVLSSKGSWLADKRLFEKNGFKQVDARGRFELMALSFSSEAEPPSILDWEKELAHYAGWHLLYADQCPWHDKAVSALEKTAKAAGVALQTTKIESAEKAQHAPSGFGVFALVKDGKLLEDHYISETRFKTILKKELT